MFLCKIFAVVLQMFVNMYFSRNDRAKFRILMSYFLPAGLINKPGMFDHSGLKVAGVTEDFFLRWKFFQTKGYVKEARNSFLGLGVYLLKSKFRIEDKHRFPWYYTTFSTNNQRLFSCWFPSNSCHHSNGNGQPLILNNVEYLEN